MEFLEVEVPSQKAVKAVSRAEWRKENGKEEVARTNASAAGKLARRSYRKTPSGKRQRAGEQTRRRDRKWVSRRFVAWDGEGVTRSDGDHYYLILANSDGHHIRNLDHLGTEAILDFCLAYADSDAIHVIYGAGYDWNMWLSDVSRADMEILYKTGHLNWRGYRLSWKPGKTFRIMRDGNSALFYDVISFFQCAFVKACISYLGDAFEDREMIEENKMLRSSFRAEDLDEIARYNEAELRNLVALMTELRSRLHKVGLKPARWDGPGAIAVALMSREKVSKHLEQSPEVVMSAIRHAYFGGRFEVIRFGHYKRKCYEYDLNSAYPWALQDVPSMADGTWELVNGDPGRQEFALYHLKYSGENSPTLPQPLPVRLESGNVVYPVHATGWYWTPEYLAATDYVKQEGGSLEVIEAWVFTPARAERPFSFIKPLYEQRRALKCAGDGAHVGIKLGLNSMYGKLAQQVGWRVDDGVLKIPPYHQLEWAGYVTSKCRAEVLRAAMRDLSSVIAFETDAVFVDRRIQVREGSGLGEWEYVQFDDITYVQSGTYFASAGGETIDRTRGVDRGNLTRDKVLEALATGKEKVPSRLTRFTGIGLALQTRWEHWRQWRTSPKEISLSPQGKRRHLTCKVCSGNGLSLGELHYTIPLWVSPDTHSTEYEVEWITTGVMADLRRGHYEAFRYQD